MNEEERINKNIDENIRIMTAIRQTEDYIRSDYFLKFMLIYLISFGLSVIGMYFLFKYGIF